MVVLILSQELAFAILRLVGIIECFPRHIKLRDLPPNAVEPMAYVLLIVAVD